MKSLRRITIPYIIWLFILVIIPLFVILLLSISSFDLFKDYEFAFTSNYFSYLVKDNVLKATYNSIFYSVIATSITLLIGYPTAYFLASLQSKYKNLYLTMIILPVWSNMLLRIIAWEKLFYANSILNSIGISLDWIGTPKAIIIGMVSMYLPFMILPIYSVLEKIDKSIIEAAKDLGASKLHVFSKVVLPLSLGGIVSGVIMTLLPAMTAFALPKRLSGGKILLIGNLIEDYFMINSNFHVGSMISLVLMLIIVLLYVSLLRFDKEGDTII